MGKKRVLCGYGVDIDAVAGWLGSYGGEDSTSDISRGSYSCHLIYLDFSLTRTQACLLAQLELAVSSNCSRRII
jgi:hypothetical protein